MLVDSKSGTVDEQIARNQNYSENALVEEATALTSYYNHYVLVLGTEFSCGDGTSRPLILLTQSQNLTSENDR